ncbi:MAG: ethanolamine permease [Chlamydiales bacterium]|jgi:ethanolamine permease
MSESHLDRSLGPVMLWGLGVGYVISGMYFGWNLGLAEGGTLGLAIATFFVALMYLTFTFSYTELACAMPQAGGAYTYASRAFGPLGGFIGGMSQIVEFVFAPPAIAAAIGAYFNLFFPGVPILLIAIVAYAIFTLLNIYGVKAAASFELWITILAVGELLLFSGLTLPHFEWENLTRNPLPNGWGGVFAAVPFAIWFFLAIEGVANVAEETVNPQKNMVKGFGSAMITLLILCGLTFFSSVGVGGWESIVYSEVGGEISDSPLPLALGQIVAQDDPMFHLLITVGLFGLIASFHGIILVAGRATFEFGRQGCFPKAVGKIHERFKTPALALLMNMAIGIVALLTGRTGEIIIIACFGALSLYIISMLALFKLRKTHPEMERPFKAPFYPYSPAIALFLAVIALISMTIYHFSLALFYYLFMAVAVVSFKLFVKGESEDMKERREVV